MNIKAIRVGHYLTQSEFAKMIGVSRLTVALWETGKRNVSLKNQKKIFDTFVK